MTAKQKEQEEARRELRKLCRPGTTVWTVLRHVSRSGMMRHIDLYVMRKGRPRWISGYAARALDYRTDSRTGALKVSGCGMDMGFHLVNSLSYALHGYDSKGEGVQGHLQHTRPGHYHAGYSLNHEWL